MRKLRVFGVLLAVAMVMAVLSGCGECTHEWKEANCASPKMCVLCGQTEGDATQDHKWEAATTDAPKTCKICKLKEGDALDVDERFHTKDCKDLFGSWQARYETDGAVLLMDDLTLKMQITITFTNEGELHVKRELEDPSAVETELAQYLSQMLYAQYSAAGMSQAEADVACKAENGMSILEFCQHRAKIVASGLGEVEEKVYFVSDGYLYTGDDWDDNMGGDAFKIQENGKLYFGDPEADDGLEFTRIATVIK